MEWTKLVDHDPTIWMYEGIRDNSVAREPETITWARDLGGGVLWDIGANVGAYTLVAAVNNPALHIVAFEPIFPNYYALMMNISRNGLEDRVLALSLALAGETQLGVMNIHSLDVGMSLNAFEMESPYTDAEPVFRQSMIAYSADDLVEQFEIPRPNHIKLDVDSIETEILFGAERTLLGVESIMVEVDRERQASDIERYLNSQGFFLAEAHEHRLTNNHIFRRQR